MNYQRISYFVRAAETLNFSEAARQTFISPQSFGKQISLLEEELGGKLFDRSPREMCLTPFGRECYERFSGPVKALDSGFLEMRELADRAGRQIRIGIFSALSKERLVFPIMGAIMLNYADKDISISLMDMTELQSAVQTGKVDIGITVTHDREGGWDHCTRYPLGRHPAQIAVSRMHEWFGRDSVSLEDMKQKDFVRMYHPEYSETDYFDHVPCRRVIEVDNYETMNMQIESGLAFSIMSDQIDEINDRGYRFLELPSDPFEFVLALVVNDSFKNPLIRDICRFIQDLCEV